MPLSNKLNKSIVNEIIEIEKHILSAIFFYYKEVEGLVELKGNSVNAFITKPGKKIFEALQKSKYYEETGFDLISVISNLKIICTNNKELEVCKNYLSKLSKNFHYYTIREKWDYLRAYNKKLKMDELAQEILNTEVNHQLINDQVIKWRNKIDEIDLLWSPSKLQTMDDVLKDWDNYVKNASIEGSIEHLKTGYSDLDNKIKHLAPGQLIVIASRPGIGKTTFALNLLNNNLKYLRKKEDENAWGMGMFSLEMTNISLIGKMLSISSYHPFSVIENLLAGKPLEDWEVDLLNNARKQLANTNVFLCDDASITLGSLISSVKRWVINNNLKVVIIDYLQIVNLPLENEQKWSSLQQYQKVGMISRALKLLAMELNICIITLAQLNRKMEERTGIDKSPILSDLRESGSIEQDADIVMFLYEEKNEEEKRTSTFLKIAKNRQGPTGTIEFTFDKCRGLYKCIGEVL